MDNRNVLIIGAGITGIGAALRMEELNIPYIIVEKEKRAGGLCRTESEDGFLFDYTGHLLHFKNDDFKKRITRILDGNVEYRERNAWIYSNTVFTKYPYQMNLYGLPENVILECLVQYCDSIYSNEKLSPDTYEDWIIQNFGKGIGKHFFVPYTKKMLKMHPRLLLPETGGRFVPKANLEGMLKGALFDQKKYSKGYNANFVYPAFGGIETIIRGLTKALPVNTEEKVIEVDLKNKTVKTEKKRLLKFNYLISTQPLPELVHSIKDVPEEIEECSKKLNWISVFNINFGIHNKNCKKHWIYFPEKEFCFYRIGFPHNFSKNVSPKGCGSVYLEISFKKNSRFNKNECIGKCVENMVHLKLIENDSNIKAIKNLDIPYAYVIYEKDTFKNVKKIKEYLQQNGVFTVGRFGGWEYFSMEDSFIDGQKTGNKIGELLKT
jgi:UDP-galactopyranose mutase